MKAIESKGNNATGFSFVYRTGFGSAIDTVVTVNGKKYIALDVVNSLLDNEIDNQVNLYDRNRLIKIKEEFNGRD